jgi:hypothetical protein
MKHDLTQGPVESDGPRLLRTPRKCPGPGCGPRPRSCLVRPVQSAPEREGTHGGSQPGKWNIARRLDRDCSAGHVLIDTIAHLVTKALK